MSVAKENVMPENVMDADVEYQPGNKLLPFRIRDLCQFNIQDGKPSLIKIENGAKGVLDWFDNEMRLTGYQDMLINDDSGLLVTKAEWRMELSLIETVRMLKDTYFRSIQYHKIRTKDGFVIRPHFFLHFSEKQYVNYGCMNVWAEQPSGHVSALMAMINSTRALDLNCLCVCKLESTDTIQNYRLTNACILTYGEGREITIDNDDKFDIHGFQLWNFMVRNNRKTYISVSKGLTASSPFYLFIFKSI